MRRLWETWKYAIGSFDDDTTKPYDNLVALIRTFWVVIHIAACFMIIIHNGIKIGWF